MTTREYVRRVLERSQKSHYDNVALVMGVWQLQKANSDLPLCDPETILREKRRKKTKSDD